MTRRLTTWASWLTMLGLLLAPSLARADLAPPPPLRFLPRPWGPVVVMVAAMALVAIAIVALFTRGLPRARLGALLPSTLLAILGIGALVTVIHQPPLALAVGLSLGVLVACDLPAVLLATRGRLSFARALAVTLVVAVASGGAGLAVAFALEL